ncbi:phosphoribosylaminoimidazole-succinocarboxamide synthase, chloroplastic-like [Rutidosis leptorrhynchoides]|uniref:phosphoribosylaminoimidazole-succinocarboxamide synthase, chloroplastic-like n=1 Tax=Rutidosis leptorrhynchoides TaxID=125765 RepID=UPI003A98EDB9
MSQADYDEASRKALSLFEYGRQVALQHGLILLDTKYDFRKGSDGSVLLIDEFHTPDSSRYWLAHSYDSRFQNGLEPENIDKVHIFSLCTYYDFQVYLTSQVNYISH